ncbi:putative cytochrome P450 hydroxylase [Pseudonocardia sp. N23]|nr:putative cytochrome P450 hydroxylase [Pseudonocardia sp. N23]
MTHEVTGRPEVTPEAFDHHSRAVATDPFGYFDALRRHGNVVRSELYGGFYTIVGYAAVSEATRDGRTFSSEVAVDGTGCPVAGREGYGGTRLPSAAARSGFIDTDGPRHLHYRRLLLPWLTPRAMQKWEPEITKLAAEAVESVRPSGSAEIVNDLASPVSAAIVMDIIGMPRTLGQQFSEALHHLIGAPPDSPERTAAERLFGAVLVDVSAAIIERYEAPSGEDLISFLCRASGPDGTRLTPDDVIEQMRLFLAGGLDTTASLITNTLIWLAGHPEQADRLRNEPELWPLATEEFLRFTTPVLGLARTVDTDTVLDGVELTAGDRLLLSFGAANHDPAEFDTPEEVILDRFPNRHLTFGVGAHRCIGSNMARSVFQGVMPVILANCLDIRVDLDRAVRYPSVSVSNGWLSVPMTFTPAPEPVVPPPYSWRSETNPSDASQEAPR